MDINSIITLDDNSKFALMDECQKDNIKYFFAIKLDNNENPTKEYDVFQETIIDDEIYMDTLDDENLKNEILVEFKNKFLNSNT